jgi:hypothetical protein
LEVPLDGAALPPDFLQAAKKESSRRQQVMIYLFIFLQNVKVMAHPLARANADRGVKVEIRWEHGKQRG